MKIGVLALQGDCQEHCDILEKLGVYSLLVKKIEDLAQIDGLIIPGGESTAISLLLKKSKLDRAIIEKHKEGMPLYGSCAGAILLAKEVKGQGTSSLGLLDVVIERNSYGRQLQSFETTLDTSRGPIKGTFIRAPKILRHNGSTEVIASFENHPVWVEQDTIIATTFHPELDREQMVHQKLISLAKEYRKIRSMQRDIESVHK